MRHLRLVLGLAVSLLFLWLAFGRQDWGQIWGHLTAAQWAWLIPAILVYFGAVYLRSVRWRVLLGPLLDVSAAELFPILVIGYAGNNLLPARGGELIRAFLLRRRRGVSASSTLGTILVERVLDVLTMVLFLGIAALLLPLPERARQAGWAGLILGLLVLGGMVLAVHHPAWILRPVSWALTPLPEGVRGRLLPFVERGLAGLASLRDPRAVLAAAAWSLLLWLVEATKYWFVMHAFPFQVPFPVLLLATALANLALVLPAAPGNVGTFDSPVILILTHFGVQGEVAGAYTLLLHAALYVPITLWGVLLLAREGLSLRRLEREAALSGAEGR